MKSTLMFIVGALLSLGSKAQETQPMLNQKAPSFMLSGVDGKSYSLDKAKGKYVVIHFAATWCPFCNAEAPNLEQLYKSYRDKGVEVFIVDVKEDKALVEKSLARFNFSFPVLLDTDGTVSASYAPADVLPALKRDEVPLASNLIIDKEGKIVFYSLLNTTSFDAKLTKLQARLDELMTSRK
jgi:peroxiredoxin